MRMSYYGKLLAELIVAGIFVYTIVFLAFAVLPLDPARSMLGPLASESAVHELSAQYGFDRPLWERYFKTLELAARGDFGQSVYYQRSVNDILWNTVPLTLGRLAAALTVGSMLGMACAFCVSLADLGSARYFFVVLQGLPAFVLMIVTLWIIAQLGGLSPYKNPMTYNIAAIGTASLYAFAAVGLYLVERLDFGERRTRQADFLLLLRAPKTHAAAILTRAYVPGVLSTAATSATTVLTAITFAEFVFDLPGFAVIFIRSCERGDLAIVASGSLILALVLLSLQITADALSRRIDVRIRN